MKKILLFKLLFSAISTFAQHYVTDDTFGNNGTIMHHDFSFYPTDALLINNNYYFISNNNMVKLNYNGAIDISFGTNGLIALDNASHYFILSGFKYNDGYFYLYGSMRDREEGNEDGFICKIDENGNFDSTFGTNNFAVANFEAQEIINDFIIDQAGELFCIGTRYDSEIFNSVRLIYFKITNHGSIQTSFDVNGFKEIAVNTYSAGRYITNYDGNLMLVGVDSFFNMQNGTRQQRLLISEVDANGNLINDFGLNGSRLVELYDGMSITLKKTELKNNNLFLNYFYSESLLNQGSRIGKYDITNNTMAFNTDTYYNANFYNTESGLFITGSERCANTADSSCPRDFNLTKLTDGGIIDTAFNGNATFTYNFPSDFYSDDISQTLVIEENGTILVAGHTTEVSEVFTSGFSLIRLTPVTMGIDNVNKHKHVVYPNPFANILNIEIPMQIKTIEIFDITGRNICNPSFTTVNGISKIDVQPISHPGSYLLKAVCTDGSLFSKVIIKQ